MCRFITSQKSTLRAGVLAQSVHTCGLCYSHSCLQRFAISWSESNYWSARNGNFFGILKLLSEFDPFGGVGQYCVTILYNFDISIFVFFKICAIFFKLGLPVLNLCFTV